RPETRSTGPLVRGGGAAGRSTASAAAAAEGTGGAEAAEASEGAEDVEGLEGVDGARIGPGVAAEAAGSLSVVASAAWPAWATACAAAEWATAPVPAWLEPSFADAGAAPVSTAGAGGGGRMRSTAGRPAA